MEQVKRFVAPLRLRSRSADAGRKVTWLELFFDLIFVAAVSQVAEPLREHYSVVGVIRFAPLFVLIWWAWTGHAVFSTRFDTDDGIQRGLTLVQMFAVAVMAANAKDALDSRSSAGFAAAYAAVRFVLVAQYFRAGQVREARPLTTRYLGGHGAAAVVWLVSAFVPAPERFWIWGVAFAIDLGTPWLAVRHSVNVPPDAVHLPERFGLFTLILLGESVVAVMQGMESQEDWTSAAATSAFLGMGISFLIWWWYFDGASAASEQPVRTKRDSVRFHIWSYAHFPLSVGIVIAGVGIQRIVTAASRAALTTTESLILTSAVTVVMLSMTAIGAASGGSPSQGLIGCQPESAARGRDTGEWIRGPFRITRRLDHDDRRTVSRTTRRVAALRTSARGARTCPCLWRVTGISRGLRDLRAHRRRRVKRIVAVGARSSSSKAGRPRESSLPRPCAAIEPEMVDQGSNSSSAIASKLTGRSMSAVRPVSRKSTAISPVGYVGREFLLCWAASFRCLIAQFGLRPKTLLGRSATASLWEIVEHASELKRKSPTYGQFAVGRTAI